MPPPGPSLAAVVVADDPPTWEALGFEMIDRTVWVGGVGVELAGREAGAGIVSWRLAEERPDGRVVEHPNGALAVDTVVAFTGDLERSMAACEELGLLPRRTREVPGTEQRQVFYNLGTAIFELVGPVPGEVEQRFWGLVVVVADLAALAERLGDRLGDIRDAVQPGRQIATLGASAGSSTAVAFMSPR